MYRQVRGTPYWFDEYAVSHRHPVNKALHWICVPLIVWSLIGLLWSLPAPGRAQLEYANWASYAVAAAVLYYAVLSMPLALGVLPVLAAMLFSVDALGQLGQVPLWAVSTAVFALAWLGQFIGHAIEGKRPSFLKDVQFLLIGPIWLLAGLYRRAGIPY
jgi:uncharacterized membrane protein YGL010W